MVWTVLSSSASLILLIALRQCLKMEKKFFTQSYRGIGIKKENYLSISVLDWPSFDISQFFESTARFIDSAISPNNEAASSALHCTKKWTLEK